jgi:hypothetical protein
MDSRLAKTGTGLGLLTFLGLATYWAFSSLFLEPGLRILYEGPLSSVQELYLALADHLGMVLLVLIVLIVCALGLARKSQDFWAAACVTLVVANLLLTAILVLRSTYVVAASSAVENAAHQHQKSKQNRPDTPAKPWKK